MSTTELNNATTATATATNDKKVVVKKVIPKATMNYLKFALVILKTGSTDIIKELLLEKSIDTIIDFVNEIVKNGNQDKEIVEMRKIALAPPKKSRAKPKAKAAAENANQADTIVSDLVSLARNENDSQSEPVPKKSRAKPKAKATADEPADGDADAKPKKSRAKPKAKATADAPVDGEATTEATTEAPAETKPKKSRAKPKADAKVADAKVADSKVADATPAEVTPELKSDDFKPADADVKPADVKPADDKPKKSRAKPKAKATTEVVAEDTAHDVAVADDC